MFKTGHTFDNDAVQTVNFRLFLQSSISRILNWLFKHSNSYFTKEVRKAVTENVLPHLHVQISNE